MITISRAAAKACRAVFRKLAGRRTGRFDPPVTLNAGPDHVRIYCASTEVAISYRDATGRGSGDLIVPLSALDTAAAAGKGEVLFRKEGPGRVAVVSGGRTVVVETPDGPTPQFPEMEGKPEFNSTMLLAALNMASTAVGDASRFALHRIRCGHGELVATDGMVLLIQGGFRFPGTGQLLLPATPVFGCPEVRDQTPVGFGRAKDHAVITAGPWAVALRIDAGSRFPDVDSIIPNLSRALTKVELTDAGLAAIRDRVPGLPVDGEQRKVVLDLSDAGIVVSAGGNRVVVAGKVSGPAVRMACDRKHLARLAELGLRRLAVTGPDKPVVAHDEVRKLVWVPLAPPAPEVEDIPTAAAPRMEAKAEVPPQESTPPEPARVLHLPAKRPEEPMHEERNGDRGWRMFGMFRPLVDRVKTTLATRAAEELETDAVVASAERRAGLFQLADRYENGGLTAVAEDIRRQATGNGAGGRFDRQLPPVRQADRKHRKSRKPVR